MYILINERVPTKERCSRLMSHIYDSAGCPHCGLDEIETHRYCLCERVIDAWLKVRDLIAQLDQEMIYESDYNLIHLNFPSLLRDNAIVWMIGHYVQFVEEEVVLKGRKVTGRQILGWLGAKAFECRYRAMPELGIIPGIHPTGIG